MEVRSAEAGAGPIAPAWFDSHLHLNDSLFDDDREAVAHAMARERIAGVCVGYDMPSSLAAIRLARRHRHLFAAVGIHPMAAGAAGQEALRQLKRWILEEPDVVGIGECGLDRSIPSVSKEEQRKALIRQLELACTVQKPLILHVRQAYGEMLEILSRYRESLPALVLHGCSASPESIRQYLQLGAFVSVGSPVTWEGAVKPKKAAAAVPADRLLIETDSPFSPPEGMRGQRNTPMTIGIVGATVSGIRGAAPEEIAGQTFRNACRAFGLPCEYGEDLFAKGQERTREG
ncbi:MAG: TatD family hydrolase [Clostridia bacterium]|nr:TatD family hydrolase [Clostridia bacterium]